MPLPLKPGENIYIDHKIKEASYAMPAMQAAHDHYTIGYMVSGDRRWIATDNIRVCHAGDFGIAKPEVYHRNCPISDVPYDRYVIKVRTEVFEPIIKIIGHTQLDISPISKRIFACCNRTAVIYSVYDEPVTALKSLEKCDGERQAKSATFCRLAPYSRLFSAYIIAF